MAMVTLPVQSLSEKRKDEQIAAANAARRSAFMVIQKKNQRDFVKDAFKKHDPTTRGISAFQLADFFIEYCGLIMPHLDDMGKPGESKPFCLPTKLTTKVIAKNHKLQNVHNKKDRWSPNLYAVVNLCIMKVTRRGEKGSPDCIGISYAEHKNEMNENGEKKCLQPQFVIVHHWGEEFSEFMQSILRHALYIEELDRQTKKEGERRSWRDVTYWCSPFSESQHRSRERNWDVFTRDSPVHDVLKATCCEGVVVTLNLMVSAFTRLWCVYEVLLADKAGKDILICTQHGPLVQDQFQRSEEQAEWAAHMVAVLRMLDIQAATCASDEDAKEIKVAIKELYGGGDDCMKRAGDDFKRILASEAIFIFALHGWWEAVNDALLLNVDPERCDRRGVRPLTYAEGLRRMAQLLPGASPPPAAAVRWAAPGGKGAAPPRVLYDEVVDILLTGELVVRKKVGDSMVQDKVIVTKANNRGEEDAEAVVDMWDDNMRKRASALRRMRAREFEGKPSFEYHRESFEKAKVRHQSLCKAEQVKRKALQHVPPESGGNLCYAPTRHHLKRAHEIVKLLHATKSVEEAKQRLQEVCKEEIDSEEANVTRDYKLIGHLRRALEAQGTDLPPACLFWQGGCIYGRGKVGDPPWKIAERAGGKLNIIKENLGKVCPVDAAALDAALEDYDKLPTGNTLMVVLSDMEPDDIMAIAQLWHLKHAELAGPPVLGMLLDFEDKDKNNIFALKMLIASLVLGLPSILHVLPPAAGKAVPDHVSRELAADAIGRRDEAIGEICRAIREFRGTSVDLYVLGPGHGNIHHILEGLRQNGAWPPAEGTKWRVRMYTGEFNLGGMGPGDLDALKTIAGMHPEGECPLVDVGKYPLFGGEESHPCTASFTTFALETFASKLNIQAPLLAGALKIFNDEFNAKLIYPEEKLFGKKCARATESQLADYMDKVKGKFGPTTIKEYAKALMESTSWPAVQDKKKSTVVAFAKDSCDSPLCDQLVFVHEWLTRKPVQHPRALTNDIGQWEVGKFSKVVPRATAVQPATADPGAKVETPVFAVQPAMVDPYDEELMDHMRHALQDFLLGHLDVLYP